MVAKRLTTGPVINVAWRCAVADAVDHNASRDGLVLHAVGGWPADALALDCRQNQAGRQQRVRRLAASKPRHGGSRGSFSGEGKAMREFRRLIVHGFRSSERAGLGLGAEHHPPLSDCTGWHGKCVASARARASREDNERVILLRRRGHYLGITGVAETLRFARARCEPRQGMPSAKGRTCYLGSNCQDGNLLSAGGDGCACGLQTPRGRIKNPRTSRRCV